MLLEQKWQLKLADHPTGEDLSTRIPASAARGNLFDSRGIPAKEPEILIQETSNKQFYLLSAFKNTEMPLA
jgi:hypothetical protein